VSWPPPVSNHCPRIAAHRHAGRNRRTRERGCAGADWSRLRPQLAQGLAQVTGGLRRREAVRSESTAGPDPPAGSSSGCSTRAAHHGPGRWHGRGCTWARLAGIRPSGSLPIGALPIATDAQLWLDGAAARLRGFVVGGPAWLHAAIRPGLLWKYSARTAACWPKAAWRCWCQPPDVMIPPDGGVVIDDCRRVRHISRVAPGAGSSAGQLMGVSPLVSRIWCFGVGRQVEGEPAPASGSAMLAQERLGTAPERRLSIAAPHDVEKRAAAAGFCHSQLTNTAGLMRSHLPAMLAIDRAADAWQPWGLSGHV